MNQKASKNQLQFPLLYNFAKDTPHVDDTFRNVEEINAPLLNDMIQPVWTKQVHNKSVFDANGNEYYFDENGVLYKNDTAIGTSSFTSKSLVKTKIDNYKKYIAFDKKGYDIGGIYYANANRNSIVIQTNITSQTFSLGTASVIDARTRLIDNVFWNVLYLDDNGVEKIKIYKGLSLVYEHTAVWAYQHCNGSNTCLFSAYYSEVGGAAPCINMAAKNGLFWVSFTKKAGTVNDLYNGSAFITLCCNQSTGTDWKQIGVDLTFSNVMSSSAKRFVADVTYNSSSSTASASVKVITPDYVDYYFYNSSATDIKQCQKCTYIPAGYGEDSNYKIGVQSLTEGESAPTDYDILQFNLYTKTYNYWLTTRSDVPIKITSINFKAINPNADGVQEGNDYQVPTVGVNTKLKSMDASGNFVLENVDYSNGKAVISFSYRYLSGQAESRIENQGSNTQASFKGSDDVVRTLSISTEYLNTGIKIAATATLSSSDVYRVPYAPCIVLDDGYFYTLFRPNINIWANSGNDNYWDGNNKSCILGQERIIFRVDSLNVFVDTYSIGGIVSGHEVPLNETPIVRSGSVVIDQNLYIMTLKLNNTGAVNPTSLNNGKSESASSRFTEVVYDSTEGRAVFLPGTSRLSSFNYYSNAVNGDPTLAGPGEDLAVFTVGGSRTTINYGNAPSDNSNFWQALYNVTTAGTAFVQGISYNKTGTNFEGTLVTPWQSIDENSYLVNSGSAVYYKDKAGDVWEIKVVNEMPKLRAILEDRLIVWNGVDYTNCYDTESGKFFHYASDYNGRMKFGSTGFKALPGAIASDAKTWAAFPYIRYTANGKNPLYQIMPRDRIMSIILPIVARYRCNVDSYNVSRCMAYSEAALFQPIDVFFSKLSSTACIYRFSIEYHGMTVDTPVNHRLQGLTYPGTITTSASLTPNIFTEYVDGAGNNDLVIDGYDSYVMTYYDNEPYLVYSATTQASNVYSERDSFFVLQGQFYGIIKDKLYALTYSNGAISQMDAIIDVQGMSFIGNTPEIAFFWNPATRAIHSFTGDAVLTKIYAASKFTSMG